MSDRKSASKETSSGPANNKPSESATTTKKPKSYKSSSAFAKLSAQGLPSEQADTLTWVFDRCISLAGRIPFTIDKLDPSARVEATEFNEKLAQYDRICGFFRPSSWHAKSCPVDSSLTRARDLLFEQAEEIQAAPLAPNSGPLTLEHQRWFEEHMSALLYASAGSFTRDIMQGRRPGINVKEAESRHDFDALLFHFYAQDQEDGSLYVLLEQSIRFARNELVELADPKSVAEAHQTQLEKDRSLCMQASQAAEDSYGPAMLISQQALIAETQAEKF
ncbi:hypothetical protein B0H10DRAFT_921729 [Mycena sp. CBHHK59/15]|nr:hypothetical protein B0H10DRAFT_921729 [Mycena sp. CBHHK59/15]